MKDCKDYTFEDFKYSVQSSEREFDFSRREFVSFYAVKPEQVSHVKPNSVQTR